MRHWLIVGASRGLGLSLVRSVCEQGARVTALAQRAEPKQDALRAQMGEGVRFIHADVRREAELEAAAHRLESDTRFDVLIYNAAVHLEHDRLDIEQASTEAMLETLDVNAIGAARAVKHFRRFLSNDGLLLFISSEAGSIGNAQRATEYGYCMSKAALNMLAKLLSNRERTRGTSVEVLTIHPGWMRTDMGGAHADISAEEAAQTILATLAARPPSGAPLFVDRRGKALPW